MAKRRKGKVAPVNTPVTDKMVYEAFHRTADTIAGDMYEACRTMGEEFKMHRLEVADYVYLHGGVDAVAVSRWMRTVDDLDKALADADVPEYWVE